MNMVRWSGSAELVFSESARLAFAKALEEAQTDVDREHPEAWLVDDRRIAFSITTETTAAVLDAYKRLLKLLVDRASAGEAVIEMESPPQRWARKAHTVSSTVRVDDTEDPDDALETIRTSAG